MATKRTSPLSPFLFCLIAASAAAQVYTVKDLGPLAPTAINTWGEVVGNYNGHAFMWTKTGGISDLGIISGGTFSRAAAIDDLGVVTGTADGPGTVISLDSSVPNQKCSDLTQPFVWRQTRGMHGLGTVGVPGLADFYWCTVPFYATGIRGLGQVVGYTGLYSDYQWGFLRTSAAGMTLFGGSWPPTLGNGISKTGQLVGQNSIYSTYGFGHATSWKSDVSTDLGTLGGEAVSYSSLANGLNDRGQVVGWSTTAPISFGECSGGDGTGCSMHAVLWTRSGAIRDLGTLSGDTLSAASKINFFGQVIGSSGNSLVFDYQGGPPEVIGRPFVWCERRGMRDLNTLIPTNSGWVLNSVADINIWGQIVGQGTRNGQPRGYLLMPKVFEF
jgi:uncharacterized membrane protein